MTDTLKVRVLITAVLALGTMITSSAFACPQTVADRLAERTEREWAQDTLRDNPISGLYTLAGIDDETYIFTLERPLTGDAPHAFETEAFMVIGCANSAYWWDEERLVGDQVVVLGDWPEGRPFLPNLLFEPESRSALLLMATAGSFEEAQ